MPKPRLPAVRGRAQVTSRSVAELGSELTSPYLEAVSGWKALRREPSGPGAWAWVVSVPNPTRPLSSCHCELGIWVPALTTRLNLLLCCWKGLDFLPKDPPLGPGCPGASPSLAGTAGGGTVALPLPLSPGSLGPALSGSDWRGLHDEAPTQRGPGPPEASPWTCQACASQSRLRISIIWGGLE